MAEMKVFVINLDEQEKDTGCAWFTLPCNIEALKQSIGLPPDSDRYLISDYDFPFEILQDTDLDLLNNICLGFVLAASGGSRMECLYIQQYSTIGSLLKKSV